MSFLQLTSGQAEGDFLKRASSLLIFFSAYWEEDNPIVINDEFVRRYYKGEGNRERLRREIANRTNVVVIFPDLIELLQKFHTDLERFVENVTSDEDYITIINDDGTVENFFEIDEEFDES